MLRDHWYGAPFRRSKLDDANAIGVTIHSAPALELSNAVSAQCMITGIERTEVVWKHKEGIKSVEMEEVLCRDERVPRYLHSERDIRVQAFRHIDGAVMLYEQDARDARRQTRWPRRVRASMKPKQFRVDGRISTDDWALLCSLYFRGNPLVGEYFAGSDRGSNVQAG